MLYTGHFSFHQEARGAKSEHWYGYFTLDHAATVPPHGPSTVLLAHGREESLPVSLETDQPRRFATLAL